MSFTMPMTFPKKKTKRFEKILIKFDLPGICIGKYRSVKTLKDGGWYRHKGTGV